MNRQERRSKQKNLAKRLVDIETTRAYIKKMEAAGLIRRKTRFERFKDKLKNLFGGWGEQRA